MYPIKNLIASMETMKATIIPIPKIIISALVKEKPNFNSFNALPPNIAGIAKKNVNSAAVVRDIPSNKAPTMVAPDLDVPGNAAAIN